MAQSGPAWNLRSLVNQINNGTSTVSKQFVLQVVIFFIFTDIFEEIQMLFVVKRVSPSYILILLKRGKNK